MKQRHHSPMSGFEYFTNVPQGTTENTRPMGKPIRRATFLVVRQKRLGIEELPLVHMRGVEMLESQQTLGSRSTCHTDFEVPHLCQEFVVCDPCPGEPDRTPTLILPESSRPSAAQSSRCMRPLFIRQLRYRFPVSRHDVD